MKLVVLHGPGVSSSRTKLIEIKSQFDVDNVVVFEKNSSIPDILANLQTVSMFVGERLVVLENPPESLDFDSFDSSDFLTLILWFDHEIAANKFPEAKVMFFPEAKEISVFPFLDALGTKNKSAYLMLQQLKKGELYDTQYIIVMIAYLLRSLIYTPVKSADFIKKKNAKMRSNFTDRELINLYRLLLETDYKIKNGLLDPSHAELLLLNRFILPSD